MVMLFDFSVFWLHADFKISLGELKIKITKERRIKKEEEYKDREFSKLQS